jgi:WD40 repeat protein
MKSKLLFCLALILSGVLPGRFNVCAQLATTNQFSNGETLARFPALQSVNSILFSPDGKTVATLRGEDTFWHKLDKPLSLQLWAVPSGKLLWTASEPAFYMCAFSPDSTLLAGLAADANLAFWNTANGRIERRFPHQNGMIGAVFVPDGRTLLTTVNKFASGQIPMSPSAGEIQFWDTKTAQLMRTLKGQPNAISKLAISLDGKTLAIANEPAGTNGGEIDISLLDLESGSLHHDLHFDKNVWTINSLVFSPDGKTLVAGGGHHDGTGEIRFWDVASGQSKKILTDFDLGSAEPRISMEPFVAFSPDGEILVSVGDKQTMIWWGVATGKMRMELREADPPEDGSLTIQFVGDGLLSAKVNSLEQVEVQFWNDKK